MTLVEQGETILDGQAISYIVRRSARARHVRLEVRWETGLTVVIPKSYKVKWLPSLLRAKQAWILGKLAKHGKVQLFSVEKELKSGDTIPFLGRNLELVIRQNHCNADSVKLEQNTLAVSLNPASNGVDVALERWYRMQAAKLIKNRADELSARLGLTYNQLVIRGQRTRWGSCSYKGNLSFNWKLMIAPEPVIDYVIIHELAHLKEMNHSKRFWSLVAEHCPWWREHRKWLRDHETALAAKVSLWGQR